MACLHQREMKIKRRMSRRFTTSIEMIFFYFSIVPVILCHYTVVAHDDDWALDDFKDHGASLISMTPSSVLQPNTNSVIPGTTPSHSGTSRHHEFQVYGLIEFDEFHDSELDETSQKIFQLVYSEFMTESLNAQGGGYFNATSRIISYQIAGLPQRGNMKTDRKHPLRKRNYFEESRPRISILIDLHLTVRTDTTYSISILIQRINSILDDLNSKEALILKLQQLDNDVFYPINSITRYVISDKIPLFEVNNEKSLDKLVMIMIIVVLGITMIATTWYLVSRHKRSTPRQEPQLLDGFSNNPNDYDIMMSTT